MDVRLETLDAALASSTKTDALIVLVAEGSLKGKDNLSSLLSKVRKAGDLPDKAGKLLQLYEPASIAATRLVLTSVGKGSPLDVRKGVTAAVSAIKGTKVQRVVIFFAQPVDAEALHGAVAAAADASYVYLTSKPKADKRTIRELTVGVASIDGLEQTFARAVAVMQGVELAKEWANRPANLCTPTMLAGAAESLGSLAGIKVEVLGPKEVEKLGMGAFKAVAQGSAEPLRFVVLRYQGRSKSAKSARAERSGKASRADAPVVLIGKGITFDTGGVSLKPAAEMDEMKFDMCGAASVLGVFRALGELQPPIDVIGLIPTCENMNDGKAVKPGDVVTSMNGQTIEVLNTDAEGRLILCDALTYAERFSPAAVIDIATLTGACVVALGHVRSALFTNDDSLASELLQAGERMQDLCWRMPLDDEYAEALKSNFADVPNIAGRAGGAITAAKFLQRFVGDMPWAHLDIAGSAWKSGSAKGATGRPVGLLLSWLVDRDRAMTPATRNRRSSRASDGTRAA